jgi:putative ABC transport system ATP-binding protein
VESPVESPEAGHSLLAGQGLVKKYGACHALAGVDLAIRSGEVVLVVGHPSAGKTTLLHVMAGVVPPDGGEVWLDGRRIDRLNEAQRSELRRRDFGLVFQNGTLIGELSAEQNVALPLMLDGAPRERAMSAARERLRGLGLDGVETLQPGQLSAGQAQRVALAAALARRPKAIFADEPADTLDTRAAEETWDALLRAASDTNVAVVIATRDRALASRVGRVVEIRDGRIVGGVLVG